MRVALASVGVSVLRPSRADTGQPGPMKDETMEGLMAYLNLRIHDKSSTLGPDATLDYMRWVKAINTAPLAGMPIGSAEFAQSVGGKIPQKILNKIANAAGLTLQQAKQSTLSLSNLIDTAASISGKNRALLVTLLDIEKLSGGAVKKKTIQNRPRFADLQEVDGEKGPGGQKKYRYDDVASWWPKQIPKFAEEIPKTSDEAKKLLLLMEESS